MPGMKAVTLLTLGFTRLCFRTVFKLNLSRWNHPKNERNPWKTSRLHSWKTTVSNLIKISSWADTCSDLQIIKPTCWFEAPWINSGGLIKIYDRPCLLCLAWPFVALKPETLTKSLAPDWERPGGFCLLAHLLLPLCSLSLFPPNHPSIFNLSSAPLLNQLRHIKLHDRHSMHYSAALSPGPYGGGAIPAISLSSKRATTPAFLLSFPSPLVLLKERERDANLNSLNA